MNRFHVFVIRAILGGAFAVFLTRFFYGEVSPLYVLGLAVFLVAMAYMMEWWRASKSGQPKR